MASMRSMMDHPEDYNDPDDDDNAQEEEEEMVENEDPLVLAMEDLEGRVVAAMDEVKVHSGVKSEASTSIHTELSILLRPILEVAAHTGPSVARTYCSGPEGVEASVELLYERIVSDLVLPILLEVAQSDPIPAKRGAVLVFLRNLWAEAHKAGSWLDSTVSGPQAGPYGSGGSGGASQPINRMVQKRRQQKYLARESEFLRYWVEAAAACLVAGVFTSEDKEGAVVGRGILAASASLRPALRHISKRIKDADDRGASRLYNPVMKMVEAVIRKLFLEDSTAAVRASSIKFLEIVILCCSRKPPDPAAARRRGQSVRSRLFTVPRFTHKLLTTRLRKAFLWTTFLRVILQLLERDWSPLPSMHSRACEG